ncbi:MAG: hypothetical protein U0354_14595 [Candidatus Sericytochromatia bacterium]
MTSNYKIINDNIRNILINLKILDINSLEDVTAENNLLERIQTIFKEYLSNLSERKIKTLSII